MILRLNQLTEKTFEDVSPADVKSISIEGPADDEKIKMLQHLLSANREIKVTLVVEPDISAKSDQLVNLEIIQILDNLRHLTLLCFSSVQLKSLQILESLQSLEFFRISGNYDKKIDLAPLRRNRNLLDFELEFGFVDKKQIDFVNGLEHLQSLKVSVLDAALMEENTNLKSLSVRNTLKNANQLSKTCPLLREFQINIAKAVESFDFLNSFQHLEELLIGNTGKLVSVPKLSSSEKIKDLKLLFTPNFSDIESILQFENLEGFALSEFTSISMNQIAKLQSLKKLRRVYLSFKDSKDEKLFNEMAYKNGWEDSLK
ncbi:MAG TPA: hypothetical protein VN040_14085 [Pseudosphingobacterium sp.]|nr:hypothetical protein [Pseudosphingobacterium sp.]